MKKAFVVFTIIAIIGTFTIAQPAVSKYWADVIRRPNQTWIQRYGYDNESVLAFNVRSLLENQEVMARTIVALTAKAEAHDPNGLHIQICNECGKAVPFQVVLCDGHDPNEVKE